jgi:hypothetical protein
MLKYAYQLGVEAAMKEAGLEKDAAAWAKMKQMLGMPLKDFEKWQLKKGLTTAAQAGRDASRNKLISRGRHQLATGMASA